MNHTVCTYSIFIIYLDAWVPRFYQCFLLKRKLSQICNVRQNAKNPANFLASSRKVLSFCHDIFSACYLKVFFFSPEITALNWQSLFEKYLCFQPICGVAPTVILSPAPLIHPIIYLYTFKRDSRAHKLVSYFKAKMVMPQTMSDVILFNSTCVSLFWTVFWISTKLVGYILTLQIWWAHY